MRAVAGGRGNAGRTWARRGADPAGEAAGRTGRRRVGHHGRGTRPRPCTAKELRSARHCPAREADCKVSQYVTKGTGPLLHSARLRFISHTVLLVVRLHGLVVVVQLRCQDLADDGCGEGQHETRQQCRAERSSGGSLAKKPDRGTSSGHRPCESALTSRERCPVCRLGVRRRDHEVVRTAASSTFDRASTGSPGMAARARRVTETALRIAGVDPWRMTPARRSVVRRHALRARHAGGDQSRDRLLERRLPARLRRRAATGSRTAARRRG